MSVIEPVATPNSTGAQRVDQRRHDGPDMAQSVESTVLAWVKEDPFMSIGEIAREITISKTNGNVGWWRVFNILRIERLLSRRARFRFSRGRRR